MLRATLLLLVFLVPGTLQFEPPVDKGKLDDKHIDDVAGLAVSRVYADVMYVHNDHGDKSKFYAIDINSGDTQAEFEVKHYDANDWEDMAYGPCVDDCMKHGCSSSVQPSRYCIYLTDTGDHDDGPMNEIVMVREPNLSKLDDDESDHHHDHDDDELSVVDTLKFSWPEHEAKTLMIDPTGQLYVMSNVDNGGAKMAALPNSAWGQDRVTLDMSKAATWKVVTSHKDPQGGDISPDGREMVLVTEDDVYYYSAPTGDFLTAVNYTNPIKLKNYVSNDDTGAIGWDPQGMGFYTLAEGDHERIYYYEKTPMIIGK